MFRNSLTSLSDTVDAIGEVLTKIEGRQLLERQRAARAEEVEALDAELAEAATRADPSAVVDLAARLARAHRDRGDLDVRIETEQQRIEELVDAAFWHPDLGALTPSQRARAQKVLGDMQTLIELLRFGARSAVSFNRFVEMLDGAESGHEPMS